MSRANPFEDLSDFEAKPPAATTKKPVEQAQIERLARENGFPSRQPTAKLQKVPAKRAGRRYTTGRNQQINIKATAETIERLYRLADREHIPLGELLERALDALEKSRAAPI